MLLSTARLGTASLISCHLQRKRPRGLSVQTQLWQRDPFPSLSVPHTSARRSTQSTGPAGSPFPTCWFLLFANSELSGVKSMGALPLTSGGPGLHPGALGSWVSHSNCAAPFLQRGVTVGPGSGIVPRLGTHRDCGLCQPCVDPVVAPFHALYN